MANENSAAMARRLFLAEYQAVLSTHSVDVEGYPFGSVVPYCMNRQGFPVILISDIAQHTKNIIADARVSLITLERAADDQQAAGRVTILGNARRLAEADDDTAARYYSYFPHARDYHKTHGFFFYCIEPIKVRFIGGFGRIHWVAPESFSLANPFTAEAERQIIEHMNADHVDAIKHYCLLQGIALAEHVQPMMVGIDAEGIHMKLEQALYRVPFPAAVRNSGEARQALVKLARQAL